MSHKGKSFESSQYHTSFANKKHHIHNALLHKALIRVTTINVKVTHLSRLHNGRRLSLSLSHTLLSYVFALLFSGADADVKSGTAVSLVFNMESLSLVVLELLDLRRPSLLRLIVYLLYNFLKHFITWCNTQHNQRTTTMCYSTIHN